MGPCGEGWTSSPNGADFGPSCYRITRTRMANYDCTQACGDNATLACIGTEAENAFVGHLLQHHSMGASSWSGHAWIGSYRATGSRGSETAWDRCASGETSKFTNWTVRRFVFATSIVQVDCATLLCIPGSNECEGWEAAPCFWSELPCVCERGSGPSDAYLTTINADLMRPAQITAAITFGCIVPVLWMVPRLVGYARRRRKQRLDSRTRAPRESPRGSAEKSPSSTNKSTTPQQIVGQRANTDSILDRREMLQLEEAEQMAKKLHAHIGGTLLELGWILLTFAMTPLVVQLLSGDEVALTFSAGAPSYYQMLVPWGLSSVMLSLRPIDSMWIRRVCILCFAACIILIPTFLFFPHTKRVNRIANLAFGIVLAYAAALLFPMLGVHYKCYGKRWSLKPKHARKLLCRLWFILRLLFVFFSALFLTHAIGPLQQDHDSILLPRGSDHTTGYFITCVSYLVAAVTFRSSVRGRIHRWLGRKSRKQQAAATVAALGEGTSADKTYRLAQKYFRVLSLDAISVTDMLTNANTGLYARTARVKLGDCDAFISHSHSDDGRDRYQALRDWGSLRPRAKVWLDRACHVKGKTALSLLPHFMMGSKQLLVLFGPTYPSRLWVLLETFVFIQVQDRTDNITVKPIGSPEDLHAALIILNVAKAECSVKHERQTILAAIETGFGDLVLFEEIVRELLGRHVKSFTQEVNESRMSGTDEISVQLVSKKRGLSFESILAFVRRRNKIRKIAVWLRERKSQSILKMRATVMKRRSSAKQDNDLGLLPPAAQDNDWCDLTKNGGCTIEKTELRAISLAQFELVNTHIRRRLSGISGNKHSKKYRRQGSRTHVESRQGWSVRRFVDGHATDHILTSASEANLYDVVTHLILPATEARACSMVELMATQEQPPDYFCSHFWGEPVQDFYCCLRQHTEDRRLMCIDGYEDGELVHEHSAYLGGRSPHYWICAYANNQHKLDSEITDDVMHTPFVRALQLSRGTVSILDANASCFNRIWCILELNESIVTNQATVSDGHAVAFTYDLYTAHQHERGYPAQKLRAVGITDGLAAADPSVANKHEREQHLPLHLINRGLELKSLEGQASVMADKERILAHIGDAHVELDDRLHGFLAASALRRAIEKGGAIKENYFRRIRSGRVRKFAIDLIDSTEDTQDTIDLLFGLLDPTCLNNCAISFVDEAAHVPEKLCDFVHLTSLRLEHWQLAKSLPEDLGRLTALTWLSLEGCVSLTELPDSIGSLVSIVHLDLSFCSMLRRLPDSICCLRQLSTWEMRSCYELRALPNGIGELSELKSLNLRNCDELRRLPDSIGELSSLTALDLDSCYLLASLPSSMAKLHSLRSLNVSYASELTQLPDLSGLRKLRHVGVNGLQEGLAEGWLRMQYGAFNVQKGVAFWVGEESPMLLPEEHSEAHCKGVRDRASGTDESSPIDLSDNFVLKLRNLKVEGSTRCLSEQSGSDSEDSE